MIGSIVHVGLSHKTAPLAVREDCVSQARHLADRLDGLGGDADAVVLLSTCGRLELYANTHQLRAAHWKQVFADLVDRPLGAVVSFLDYSTSESAIDHILRVSSGLESQILGEEHILRQVRQASESAGAHGRLGPNLGYVFRAALRTGRRVRHETQLNRIPRSYGRLAARRLCAMHPGPHKLRVLILGSGSMASEVAVELSSHDRFNLMVSGRNPQRADAFAGRYHTTVLPWEHLHTEVEAADAVFACTSSMVPLINTAHLVSRGHPLTLFDLGLPRNIHPDVMNASGNRLFDLDDLSVARDRQCEAVQQAEQIIAHERRRVMAWFHKRRLHARNVQVVPDGVPRSKCLIAVKEVAA